MIRTKKIERQIIIVSHNANLVVATDSENVIVANQEGQATHTTKNRHRFEYVNGALEFSFPKNEEISGILFQQGIKSMFVTYSKEVMKRSNTVSASIFIIINHIMITKQEILQLLADTECHSVERTTSKNDMDKFCQAICAFPTIFREMERMVI